MLDNQNRIFNCMFIKHLEEQNMSYFEHLKHACSYALQAVGCSLVFVVHGFIPGLFEKTGSTMIQQLNDQLNGNRIKNENIKKII
jgi:hypothetical protein